MNQGDMFMAGFSAGALLTLGICELRRWAHSNEPVLPHKYQKANTKRSLDDIPDVLARCQAGWRPPGNDLRLLAKANEGRMNHDIPDVLAGNLDALFAARELQISEQQANESRHSRRDTVTMGDVFGDDFPFVLPEKGESKANASRHSRRVGGKA